jgi:hypothetical protein
MKMIVTGGLVALLASGCFGGSAASGSAAAARAETQIQQQVVPGTSLLKPTRPTDVASNIVEGGALAECVGRFPEASAGSRNFKRELVPMSFYLTNGRLTRPDCAATHGRWINPFCSG